MDNEMEQDKLIVSLKDQISRAPGRKVVVRWFDGYIETICPVKEWRAGAYLLWIKLENGTHRHIPLAQVRWFEPIPDEMPR